MKRFLVVASAVVLASAVRGELPVPEQPRYAMIEDTVYLQETSRHILSDDPVLAVAVYGDAVWAGGEAGVYRVAGDGLVADRGVRGPVRRLAVANDRLWASSEAGLWRQDGAGWTRISEQPVAGVCAYNGQTIAASGRALHAVEGEKLVAITPEARGPLLGLAAYAGTVYVHDGRRIGLLEQGRITFDYLTDWGSLQHGSTIRDMMGHGSRLVLATDDGLAVLRGMTWYNVRGPEGLCYEDTTSLAEGFDRELWAGSTRGAMREVEGDFQYYGYQRWIPNDRVNAIASGDQVVYIATDGGIGVIRYEPYTLAKKAAYYERWLEEWGMKRLGFVHSLNLIDGEWRREVSDNDVGYSSHYLAAKCFEYAVTGSEAARAEAVDMMKSVKWSEEITSIPGFPARSIYNVGEPTLKAMHGSGGLPAEWHRTEDGVWEWKGDTSSDETDAHLYETALFLELVANEEEKVWATEHLHRVFGHIVDNGFMLRDVDGEPTRWARWDPEYLQTPYGEYARGLNGMGAFNYMTTALHFTGDPKFRAGKDQLLGWNYLGAILRQKLTFHPGYFTHFDDRLAFYSYFSLIRYETDPELKAIWLRSLERSWEVKRIEGVPWFNFIYGALTGNECEADRAVEHLRAWPLDLRKYTFRNSHRKDLYPPDGYRTYAERPMPMTPRETSPERWDGDFMRLDGGHNGEVVADPGGWLDAYWMGRYFGMISPPRTDDPALTGVPERGFRQGAAPYNGPARPPLEHER
ncbi:MAG: hypothetical protein KF886_11210 [Candidatus Hydrogenedentes bacterium]|nr:hypothetical protein [Candidatus Hydrogenedentota bacterium]